MISGRKEQAKGPVDDGRMENFRRGNIVTNNESRVPG